MEINSFRIWDLCRRQRANRVIQRIEEGINKGVKQKFIKKGSRKKRKRRIRLLFFLNPTIQRTKNNRSSMPTRKNKKTFPEKTNYETNIKQIFARQNQSKNGEQSRKILMNPQNLP